MVVENGMSVLELDELKDGKKMNVSYGGSGVSTLTGVSVLCYVIATISLVVGMVWAVVALGSYDDNAWIPIVVGVVGFLNFFIVGAICKAVAEIGRTALYQNHLLKIMVSLLSEKGKNM